MTKTIKDKIGSGVAQALEGVQVMVTKPSNSWTDKFGTVWKRDPNGGYHLVQSGGGTDPTVTLKGKNIIIDGGKISSDGNGNLTTGTLTTGKISSDGGLISSDGSGTLSVKSLVIDGVPFDSAYLPLNFKGDQTIDLNGNRFNITYDSTTPNLSSSFGISKDTNSSFLYLKNGTTNDYDVSIVSSGGTDGSNGEGTLTITSKSFFISPVDDTDNSNQVATTKYVQDNLGNYVKSTSLNNYLTKVDAASLYVPLSTSNYSFDTSKGSDTANFDVTGNAITGSTTGVYSISGGRGISLNSSIITMADLPTTDPSIGNTSVSNALWNDRGFVVMSGSNADRFIGHTHLIAFATTYPASLEVISMFVANTNYTIAINFAGSVGKIDTPPSSTYVLSVQKNNTEIGTITISTTGTFTFATTDQSNTIQVVTDDVISIVGNNNSNSAMNNLTINLELIQA